MNYKTVRELATEFNISKEAIYKKINYSMKNELNNHIVKKNKTTYITQEGESIIFNSLKHEIKENIQVSNQNCNNFNYVSILENQLDNSKKENKRLKDINKDLNYKLYIKKIENMKLKESQSNKYSYFKFIKNLFNKILIKY